MLTWLLGAVTGRIQKWCLFLGRIAVRKLLLRGYRVRMLIRNKQLSEDMIIPASAELMEGDITDPTICQEAVKDMDKVTSQHSI